MSIRHTALSAIARTIAVVSLFSLSACNGNSSSAQQSPVPQGASLSAIEVRTAKVLNEITFDGTLEALNQATVSAQTGGRVSSLPYDIGDYVEQGATIASLTSLEQSTQVEAATSGLTEVKAHLAEAKKNHERSTQVYEKKLIAKAEMDHSSAALKAAKARVESAQANLNSARQNLSYTIIKAPYSGIILDRHVQIGEVVAPGSALLSGVSLEHLRAVVNIPQQHIGSLRKHHKASIVLANGTSLSAADIRISPGANPSTHTFRVLVTLPKGISGAFPGTLVKVSFVTGDKQQLQIPSQALVQRGELTGVYTIDNTQMIRLRYVRAGDATTDGHTPIFSGLKNGDKIATDPITAAIAYKKQYAVVGNDSH